MNDIRDDTLAALLDDSVRGIEPSTEARLGAIRRRGSARRAVRWAALGTTLAVSLGAVVWAGLALRTQDTEPSSVLIGPAPAGWRTDQDNRLGLAFDHPESWPIGLVDTTCRVTFEGVLVSNHPLEFGDAAVLDDCVPFTVRLRDDLVIVAITRWEGGPSPSSSERPDTTFPISVDDFELGLGLWPQALSALKDELGVATLPLQVGGDDRYAVRLFQSHAQSREDGHIAGQIIASIGLVDPCESAPDLIAGALSCEEALEKAIQELPTDLRILEARYEASGQGSVWVFVTAAVRYYTRSIGGDFTVCSEGSREILIDAVTGDFVRALGVGRFVPCPGPSS